MKLSIILCTHNPRADHIAETIRSVDAQRPPPEDTELLVVDNASQPPIDAGALADLRLPARIVREPEAGLTPARLRGIAEADAPLLLFIDDDNVLDPDYIAQMRRRFETIPDLGCAGGTIVPRYERPPDPAWASLAGCLALRTVESEGVTDRFSGALHLPYGAGMGLRREVAEHYVRLVESDPDRRSFGRKGGVLNSADDLDMACCAYDIGLRCGLFPELKLTHLIPEARTRPAYLKRLAVNIAASCYLLWRKRGEPKRSAGRLLVETVKTLLRGRNLRRRLLFLRGSWRACLLGR